MSNKRLLKKLSNHLNSDLEWFGIFWWYKFYIQNYGTIDDKVKGNFFKKIYLFLARLEKNFIIRLPITIAFEKIYIKKLSRLSFKKIISSINIREINIKELTIIETSPIRFFIKANLSEKVRFVVLSIWIMLILYIKGFRSFFYSDLLKHYKNCKDIILSNSKLTNCEVFYHEGDFQPIIKIFSSVISSLNKKSKIIYSPHGLVYDPLSQFIYADQIKTIFKGQIVKAIKYKNIKDFKFLLLNHKFEYLYKSTIHEKKIFKKNITLYLQGFDWTSINQSLLRQARAIKTLSKFNNVKLMFHPVDKKNLFILIWFHLINSRKNYLNCKGSLNLTFYSTILVEKDCNLIRSGSSYYLDDFFFS